MEVSGRVVQLVARLTHEPEVPGSIWPLFAYIFPLIQEVQLSVIGGPSLPRNSVIRLIDLPGMIIAVNRGRKTNNNN